MAGNIQYDVLLSELASNSTWMLLSFGTSLRGSTLILDLLPADFVWISTTSAVEIRDGARGAWPLLSSFIGWSRREGKGAAEWGVTVAAIRGNLATMRSKTGRGEYSHHILPY